MKDPWNWFDWITYLFMFVTSVLVMICLTQSEDMASSSWFKEVSLWTSRLMCITLVFIWMKLFK